MTTRKPTDAELARAVKALEKKFALAGKRVIVCNVEDVIDFARRLGAGQVTDQSGNGFHLQAVPRHY